MKTQVVNVALWRQYEPLRNFMTYFVNFSTSLEANINICEYLIVYTAFLNTVEPLLRGPLN